jgi:hypothetical protein
MSRRTRGHRLLSRALAAVWLSLLAACDVQGSSVATLGTPSVSAPTARSGSPLMLPDLLARPPQELRVTVAPSTGQRQIRFSTSVINTGSGPLEVTGANDRRTGRTIATQQIRAIDRSITPRLAGNFVFHSQHDHWHFEEFTSFELWTHHADGSLQRLVTSTGKMSFCIWDSDRMAEPISDAPPERTYERCPQTVQGLSVGWVDTYAARTPGQHLTIEGVPNGTYAIRSAVDPANRLMESNDANNHSVVYVRLTGSRVERIPSP